MAAATDSHLAGPEVIVVGYMTLVAGAAAIGGFLFGYDSAVINGAVPDIQATFKSGSAATGLAVASIFFAAVAIIFVVQYIRETRGRTLEEM